MHSYYKQLISTISLLSSINYCHVSKLNFVFYDFDIIKESKSNIKDLRNFIVSTSELLYKEISIISSISTHSVLAFYVCLELDVCKSINHRRMENRL